jgi:hypothetical protein
LAVVAVVEPVVVGGGVVVAGVVVAGVVIAGVVVAEAPATVVVVVELSASFWRLVLT